MTQDQTPRIQQLMFVEQGDRPDTFIAPALETDMPRTFGGQIAAQTVRAVQEYYRRTAQGQSGVGMNSLHSYFLNPGDPSLPLQIQVVALREGRSFSVYQAFAQQNDVIKYIAYVSFENFVSPGVEHVLSSRPAPDPDSVEDPVSELSPLHKWLRNEWCEWDFRAVGRDKQPELHQQVWIRSKYPVYNPATMQAFHEQDILAAGLIYVSDMTLLGNVSGWHFGKKIQEASLDHSLWLYHPVSVDQWVLYESESPIAHDGRGLGLGRIYSDDILSCQTAQEGLTRIVEDE